MVSVVRRRHMALGRAVKWLAMWYLGLVSHSLTDDEQHRFEAEAAARYNDLLSLGGLTRDDVRAAHRQMADSASRPWDDAPGGWRSMRRYCRMARSSTGGLGDRS